MRPGNFEIDPQLQREAEVAVAKWKEDRKKRGTKTTTQERKLARAHRA